MRRSEINAFCENKGWLFEDLKAAFQRAGVRASDEPHPTSEAYICIRSSELSKSPRYDRTVVQIHDLKPPTNLAAFEATCGLSFMHPIQAWYWRNAGYKGRFMTLPIGARDAITLPKSMPQNPTVGFFCGEDKQFNKGSPLFAKAVQLARKVAPFDCLLIGRGLKHISNLGHYEEHAALPEDYARIDVLVCTSRSPAVPLSVYEAMAAGKPVISTPRWIPGEKLPAVHFAETAEELAQKICAVLAAREKNFRNRRQLRWREYLFSDWLKANINFTKTAVRDYYDRL